jgi:hypothetical protein
MSELISVSAQLSLLSAAGTFGSTMTDSDDEEKSLECIERLSPGSSERALIRNSVDDDEKSKEGICSIYKIGKTLGQ